jgi:hypothetical protein
MRVGCQSSVYAGWSVRFADRTESWQPTRSRDSYASATARMTPKNSEVDRRQALPRRREKRGERRLLRRDRLGVACPVARKNARRRSSPDASSSRLRGPLRRELCHVGIAAAVAVGASVRLGFDDLTDSRPSPPEDHGRIVVQRRPPPGRTPCSAHSGRPTGPRAVDLLVARCEITIGRCHHPIRVGRRLRIDSLQRPQLDVRCGGIARTRATSESARISLSRPTSHAAICSCCICPRSRARWARADAAPASAACRPARRDPPALLRLLQSCGG